MLYVVVECVLDGFGLIVTGEVGNGNFRAAALDEEFFQFQSGSLRVPVDRCVGNQHAGSLDGIARPRIVLFHRMGDFAGSRENWSMQRTNHLDL